MFQIMRFHNYLIIPTTSLPMLHYRNSIKKMSLTAILKKIEKVNQKHQEIQKRFNSSGKGCARLLELQQQSQEDQRIYGYSNSQILNLFKQGSKHQTTETRPTTAQPFNILSKHQISNQSAQIHIRRVHSAKKSMVSYKQQYNFLFKEDIFDQNHEKSKKILLFRQISCNNQRLQLKFKDSLKKNERKAHAETTTQQKKQFIRSFEVNLQNMKSNSTQKSLLNKKSSKQITYDRRQTSNIEKQKSQEQIQLFRLTKPQFSHYLHKQEINFTQSLLNLQQIKQFLGMKYESKINFENKKSILLFQSFYDEVVKELPPQFSITFVLVPSLKSVKFNIIIKNEEMMLQQTRQMLDLQLLIDKLLNQHGFIHAYFHSKGELVYDIFLLGKNLLSSEVVQNQILLLSYYLQRFLLLDKTTSLKVVQQTTDLIFKSNIDIPDQFFDFVTTLKNKCCQFYDKESRYYSLRLKDIVNNGIRAVLAFKKEMGLGQKVVKLKKGTKKQIKNYINNWAYFYICFSNIMRIEYDLVLSLTSRMYSDRTSLI